MSEDEKSEESAEETIPEESKEAIDEAIALTDAEESSVEVKDDLPSTETTKPKSRIRQMLDRKKNQAEDESKPEATEGDTQPPEETPVAETPVAQSKQEIADKTAARVKLAIDDVRVRGKVLTVIQAKAILDSMQIAKGDRRVYKHDKRFTVIDQYRNLRAMIKDRSSQSVLNLHASKAIVRFYNDYKVS